ncbi:MAG TPA: hypothetical protein VK195_09680, partial [Burkholderiaceae bacterium]|nr:hypothetical protein [Burkholderiaceae bacterium]
MQLGPNNSEMQRSQRNLTVGAFSVLMPFVAVVQAFVVMGFLRWAWRAKRWLLALVAMLAIAASVLAGLDWMQN